MAEFTATARIPCRPLSYENVSMAYNKELIADYTTGNLYVKKTDGTLLDVTAVVEASVVEQIKDDPTIAGEITINIEGQEYKLDAIITENTDMVANLNDALGYRVDPSTGEVHFDLLDKIAIINPETGEVEVTVTADEVIETSDRIFITPEEKASFEKATYPDVITAVIPGGEAAWTGTEAPYSQQVTVAGILETDVPVIDISLENAGQIYETVEKQLDSYAYIYKINTYDGYIMVYASKPTEVDITIQMRIDR